MGWLYTHKDSSVSVKDFLINKVNYQKDDGRYGKVLDIAIKNLKTAYMAYEIYTPENGVRVVAFIFLLDYVPKDYYNFGYKDMDETEGSCEPECPERIMKLLTPTDSKYANAWRERCWENIRKAKAIKKLKVGMRIRFPKPLTFGNGDIVQEFVVYDAKKRLFDNPNKSYARYHIRDSFLSEAEVISDQPQLLFQN